MQLTDEQQKDLCKATETYGLSLIVLFGSAATGKTHKGSDIDIAVRAKDELSLMDEARLIGEFCKLFKRNDVEIVNLAHAQPLLLREIATNGRPLFQENPFLFGRFQIYALRRYFEAAPIFKMKEQQLEAFLSK